MEQKRTLFGRRPAVLTITALALFGLTACSSSTHSASGTNSSTTTGAQPGTEPLSYFQNQLHQEESTPHSAIPGPNAPAKNPGPKSVVILSCSAATTGCADEATGATQAAEALGWTAKTVNGQGTAQSYVTAMLTAISLHPNAIILTNIPPDEIASGIQQAKADGIKVIETIYQDNPTVYPFTQIGSAATGIAADLAFNYAAQETTAANYMISQTGGHVHAIGLTLPTYQEPDTMFAAQLKKCAGCSYKAIQVNFSDFTTKLAPTIAAALIANPSINYIFAGPGDFEPLVKQAITQAHALGKVHVVFTDCQGPGATSLTTDQVVSMCEDMGSGFNGWSAIDSAVRLFDNLSFPTNQVYPFWVMTNNNPPPGGANFQGWSGYQALYKRLWGLS